MDAWGRELILRGIEDRLVIMSLGEDGADGTSDDIVMTVAKRELDDVGRPGE